jgi:hypothetical protein
MNPEISTIAAELSALERADFDDAEAHVQLNALCDRLAAIGSVGESAPLMFHFIEHMPGADLGSPGPLVHTLEAMGGYEPFLRESVTRSPTHLTVWMVNRICNARRPDRASWVEVLELVSQNTNVAPGIREEARHFLEVQHAA